MKRSIPKPLLTLIIKNNTGSTLPAQLLQPGNPNDISNQPQTYHANLSGVTYSTMVSIQFRTRGSAGPYTTFMAKLLNQNITGLVAALNTLNIGSFWQTSSTSIDGASSENEFGFLIIGSTLMLNVNATIGLNASITMLFSAAATGYIDWGDSNQSSFSSTTNATLSHMYTAAASLSISIFIDNVDFLKKLTATNDNITGVVNLSQATQVSVLLLNGNSLTALDISSNTLITGINISNNLLPTSVINATLILLDTFGLLAGNYQSNGQTPAAPPSGAGAAAKISLQGKGWTVNTD